MQSFMNFPDRLLELEPPDYGVHTTGIYVIDDDGIGVRAGPFESETAAINARRYCSEVI